MPDQHSHTNPDQHVRFNPAEPSTGRPSIQLSWPLFSPLLLWWAWAPAPAAVAHSLPESWREPLTLEMELSPAVTAQAQPGDAPTAVPSGGSSSPQPGKEEGLAKAAQNPIANLISLPFQNNTNFGVGPEGARTQNVLNIQPVIPVELSKGLLMVTRTIVPFIDQPTSATGRQGRVGLGDINPQFYFTPKTNSTITWGVGPTMVLPTATDEIFGQGKWSAGPAAVVVVSTGNMVFGAVGNNVWSFAGSSARKDVNQLLVQPFFNYNLARGWYLVTGPIITADWQAENSDDTWTVPLGGGFGRVFAIGEQKVNATLQAYWNVVKPENAGDWSLRAQIQFLFPR